MNKKICIKVTYLNMHHQICIFIIPHGNNEHGDMKFRKKKYIKWFLFFMSCAMSKYGI